MSPPALTDAESLKYVELSEESGVRTTVETSAQIFRGSQGYRGADFLAVEEPLEIQLAYGPLGARLVKAISVTMRTPGHDFELANQVGMYATVDVSPRGTLDLIVEKDFACLDGSDADNLDTFANPTGICA